MTHATLTRFVLISLLAHAGLLLSWPETPSAPVTTAAGGAPLQLALKAPSRDVARQSEATLSRIEPESIDRQESPAAMNKPARPPQSVEDIAAVRQAAPAESSEAPSPISGQTPAVEGDNVGDRIVDLTPNSPNSVRGSVGEGELRARIGEAVETYFYYPPLARRRGWEGEVVVAVRVDGDGRLSAIEVVASSGYRVLDSAAVDSLTRLARLPESADLPAAGIELNVPVRYRLIDRPV